MSRHLSTRNILSKSMHAFSSNLANRQTDKHRWQSHIPPLQEVSEFRWINSSLCQRNCTRYSSCKRRLLRGLPRGWEWRMHRVGAMWNQRFCESCANEVFRQGRGCPICRAGINMILRLYWCATILIVWTVLLICRTMDVTFCLCSVTFIFYIDDASLVFRRCMCTVIVFLIFWNVFNWWYRV